MLVNLVIQKSIDTEESTRKRVETLIEGAKYCIWTRNIWFFDWKIQQQLCNKARKQVSVEMVLPEDFVSENRDWIDFQEFIDAGVELFAENNMNRRQLAEIFLIDDVLLINRKLDRQMKRKQNSGVGFLPRTPENARRVYLENKALNTRCLYAGR